MAEDEGTAMDRLRERLGGLERMFERLDERGKGWLGKDDATRLMEYAAEGDNRLREDVGGRVSEFRIEVREAFKHAEKEYSAALYKSSTESESRLKAEFATMIAPLLAQQQSQQQPPASDRRSGVHPVVPWVGGPGLGGILVYLILALFGYAPHP